MDAFEDRKQILFNQLVEAQRHYTEAYYILQDMLTDGLLERYDYNRIIRIYFDTGDVLTDGVLNVFDVFNQIKFRKSNPDMEVEK
jgi:hypothetical protein